MKKNNIKYIVLLLVAVLIAIPIIVGVYLKNTNNNPNLETTTLETKTFNEEEDEYMKEIIEKNKKTPVFESDFSKSETEIKDILDNVLESANTYYNKYWETTFFLTKHGYFYEKALEDFIYLKELFELTDLKEEYLNEPVYLLYLKPEDVNNKLNLNMDIQKNELTLFTSYETEDGYYLKSKKLETLKVSKEDYKNLMEYYITEPTPYGKVYSEEEDYELILKAIKEKTGIEKYDVRIMLMDKRFSYVVLSPEDKQNNINGFIVEKIENNWEVKFENTEKFSRVYNEVNSKLINFDLRMINHNLYLDSKYFVKDFSSFVEYLTEYNEVNETIEDLIFASGTTEFVFLQFKKSGAFLGNLNENGVWIMYPVESNEDAIIKMASIIENPPTYILKQEF